MGIKTYKAYSYKSSSSPGKMYTTLLLEDGEITCNCPGWTRRVATDGSRICKHCDDVMAKKDYKDLMLKIRGKYKSVEMSLSDVADLSKDGTVGIDLTEAKYVEKEPLSDPLGTASERVEKMFNILRDYGYMCFRNYYHRRNTAIKSLRTAIEARTKKDIPVSGCVWLDRDWTRDVDGDVGIFKASVYVPDGNVASVMYGEIKEAAQRSGIVVTSELKDLASFGLVVLQKSETVLPF